MNETEPKNSFDVLELTDEAGLDCLRSRWSLESRPSEARNLIFWDSFEWGVWFGGYLLYSCNNRYHLTDRLDRWPEIALYEEAAPDARRFWQEFETGPMRTALRELLGLRALAAVAEGIFRQQQYDLRNDDGKVICRLELRSVSAVNPERLLLQDCRLLPLRGYETEAAEVAACLTGAGATVHQQHPVELLLRQSGNLPRRYTLRPDFGLKAAMPTREAVSSIVRAMLDLVHANLPGMLQDLDTEFLHDYRICLRKIRSLLSLVKGVYPAADTRRIRATLGDLARQTNRLRDLDVYLLAREEYLELVHPAFRPALNSMFDDFSAERDKESRRIASKIKSSAVRRLRIEISACFSVEALHGPSPAAELPVGPLVFAAIYRRYRKICKLAAGIDGATPDEGIHQLRIECKKLRYLMEFFNELIPKEAGAILQKQLRRLQGLLGEFNDASVQQKSLLEYREQRKPGPEVALGLGGLVSILYRHQQKARSLIGQSLGEFCSGSTAAVFKRTFKLPVSVFATDDHRQTDQ